MIKSCKKCKTNCCKTGPGPHKAVSKEKYLSDFGEPKSYNTKCAELTAQGVCNIWNTKDFPEECKTYVCHVRSFSKKELAEMGLNEY